MSGHKKQHFVPQSYLRAWCDANVPKGHEPYVWLFERDGSNPRRKAPENIFHETDLYTINSPDGGRNLVLEHGLSQLEGRFVSIRDRRLNVRQPINDEERLLLCTFIAATHERTPARRDHLAGEWGKVKAMADRLADWAKTASPEQRQAASHEGPRSGAEISYEEVKLAAEKPLQTLMLPAITGIVPYLYRLDLAIFNCDEDDGFITSDNPCVWFDADACKRPPQFQSPALMYPTIEITLPISPSQIVLLNRRGISGYIPIGGSDPRRRRVVDEFNRRTRFGCRQYFVNNSSTINRVWFDPGVEPADSWRSRSARSGEGEPNS